ncbi:flagellar motor protein [Geosporobacter ferrireducens]|uniref:Flagellar motor protein MotP n=1 Tax=Geosporobacter ferrireducens TaxID=1424294 RepID=A0A1D8GBJ3_9FIRM|nr:flagellar motor protein [Geosporobacter ferrireducens]AOT68274.1 flagellar motor protein MotP [Geosporobacter ferrireducens]MTI57304.1 flagellar motor protein [Geosporobacter ferrireducens]
MDLATIIGIIVGMTFIIGGILLDGSLLSFWNLPSIVIVLGGTVASTLVAFPLRKVTQSFTVVRKAFSSKDLAPGETISKIIELANTARREGLLALEEACENIDDEFLQKGAMLIVDGTDPELVRNILETELAFLEERHGEGKSIFDSMGSASPAFGMIGTLIGLINMLQRLEDPKSVGPSMAVALITTFYGSLLANLVFIPIATKLKTRSREEILIKEIMVEGLLSIQAGENPRIIEEKLKAFLPPKVRKGLQNGKGEGVEA